jgi:hypothetical protein
MNFLDIPNSNWQNDKTKTRQYLLGSKRHWKKMIGYVKERIKTEKKAMLVEMYIKQREEYESYIKILDKLLSVDIQLKSFLVKTKANTRKIKTEDILNGDIKIFKSKYQAGKGIGASASAIYQSLYGSGICKGYKISYVDV